jgi:lipoprotein signal peptidase
MGLIIGGALGNITDRIFMGIAAGMAVFFTAMLSILFTLTYHR